MSAPKVLDRAPRRAPPEEALRFLQTVPFFNELSTQDREAFCERGEILETPGGERLAKFIGKKGAEFALLERYKHQGLN